MDEVHEINRKHRIDTMRSAMIYMAGVFTAFGSVSAAHGVWWFAGLFAAASLTMMIAADI